MRHIYDDTRDSISSELYATIVLIAIIIGAIFLLRGCENSSIKTEIMKAESITIDGENYKTTDISDVYTEGGFYDEDYTIVLKDGTTIHFDEYKLNYKE